MLETNYIQMYLLKYINKCTHNKLASLGIHITLFQIIAKNENKVCKTKNFISIISYRVVNVKAQFHLYNYFTSLDMHITSK